ncbi:hypothetical protein [Allosphingosinicella flava]|nr:hypothetical protein [Sphingosinicella flava]
MLKKLIAGAAAVALTATPVMASASPASALSLRSGIEMQDENGLGGGFGLVALVGVALAALLVVAVTDDDDDEELPASA